MFETEAEKERASEYYSFRNDNRPMNTFYMKYEGGTVSSKEIIVCFNSLWQ